MGPRPSTPQDLARSLGNRARTQDRCPARCQNGLVSGPRENRQVWDAQLQRARHRPTATISNIMGTTPCIEPNYKNLYVKSNLSGSFIVLNAELVKDLKQAGLWSQEMLDQLKYFDGELDAIDDIPAALSSSTRLSLGLAMNTSSTPPPAVRKWLDRSIRQPDRRCAGSTQDALPHIPPRLGQRTQNHVTTCARSRRRTLRRQRDRRQKGLRGLATAGGKREFTPEEQNACSLDAMMNGGTCEACQ